MKDKEMEKAAILFQKWNDFEKELLEYTDEIKDEIRTELLKTEFSLKLFDKFKNIHDAVKEVRKTTDFMQMMLERLVAMSKSLKEQK